jgi:hypothetical protein
VVDAVYQPTLKDIVAYGAASFPLFPSLLHVENPADNLVSGGPCRRWRLFTSGNCLRGRTQTVSYYVLLDPARSLR